jgi:hypothetical protein
MITATGIKEGWGEVQLRFDAMANNFQNEYINKILYLANGREVSARRARKLRKRNNVSIRYWATTINGKIRYRWSRKHELHRD